jgi:transposase
MNTAGSLDEKEAQRRRAVALTKAGHSARQIAEALAVDARTVRRWRAAVRASGEAGLRPRRAPGAEAKLKPRQRRDLVQRLLRGARSQGFSTDLWTSRRVQELVRRHYGVQYHLNYFPILLKALGFSCQKPERQARERDEAAIGQWIRRDWPRVKKKSRVAGRPSFLSTKRPST